jgi:hypothetical protein
MFFVIVKISTSLRQKSITFFPKISTNMLFIGTWYHEARSSFVAAYLLEEK